MEARSSLQSQASRLYLREACCKLLSHVKRDTTDGKRVCFVVCLPLVVAFFVFVFFFVFGVR